MTPCEVRPGHRCPSCSRPRRCRSPRPAAPHGREPDPYAALASGIRRLPIAIVHGTADEVVPVAESRALAAALERLGASVRYEEYPDTGHVGAAQKAYGDAALFDWLISHH